MRRRQASPIHPAGPAAGNHGSPSSTGVKERPLPGSPVSGLPPGLGSLRLRGPTAGKGSWGDRLTGDPRRRLMADPEALWALASASLQRGRRTGAGVGSGAGEARQGASRTAGKVWALPWASPGTEQERPGSGTWCGAVRPEARGHRQENAGQSARCRPPTSWVSRSFSSDPGEARHRSLLTHWRVGKWP